MNSGVWIFFLLTITLCFSTKAYSIDSNPLCYGQACPTGTTSCKKHMISQRDNYMSITINCLDGEDGSLKTYFFEEPTALNSNTKYESTSYTDIGGGSQTFNRYRGLGRRNNEVEDLLY